MAARRADTGEPWRHRGVMNSNEGNALAHAALSVPRMYALVWPVYGAAVLAIDTRVGIGGEQIGRAHV